MPPAPAPPLDLIKDAIAAIFLRLPPDEPEHLFRAALVCKRWLRIICDAGFLRLYRAFHGSPPLLGLLHRFQVLDGDPAPRFASTTSVPDFPHPKSDSDGRRMRPLDCRHGRVLIHMLEDENESMEYLLCWNPVTGHRHGLPEPEIHRIDYSAAVFCAADGCDHLDCHDGRFRVAFVGSDGRLDIMWASVYSSETRAWSEPVSLHNGRDFYVQPRRGALVGGEIFFTIARSAGIVRYDWSKNSLSVMKPPPPETYNGIVTLMAMDGGSLGLAGIKNSRLYLWSTKVNAERDAGWVKCRVMELETMMPMTKPHDTTSVVGFAEGLDIIFVRSRSVGLFAIHLKSGRVRKVDEPGVYFSVLPYMSFYTPDRGALLSLARTL